MNLVKVTDLDLIVFLVAKNHQIKNSKLEGNRSIFYFQDNEELQKDIVKFANGNEEINMTDFQAVNSRVKTLIYHNKNK